jgi:hypothetical protein
VVRVRGHDPDVEERPGTDRSRHVHHLVGPGPALDPTLSAHALHQDLERATDRLSHALERDGFLHLDETVEPLLDDLLGNLIRHRGRRGPGPRRVLERERLVEPCGGHHIECSPEVFLGLSGEAHDDVRGDGHTWDGLTDPIKPREVPLAPVGPLHRPQDSVRTRLEREVDVLAHLLAVRHGLDDVGCEVVRVRAGESDAADPLDRVHGPKQIREQRAPPGPLYREVPPVGVHVLAEERDLHDPTTGQPLDLGQHVADLTRQLRPPDERHDAERAVVVAPHRDRHPGVVGHLPSGWQRAGEHLRELPDVHLGALGLGAPQELEQSGQGMGSDDHVDPRRSLLDLAPVLLGEAPRHHDPQARVRLLQRPEMSQVAVQPIVGVLSHRARVQHDHLGVGSLLRSDEAVGLEETGDPLGVVLVHLAPEGADQVPAAHRHLRLPLGRPLITARTRPPGSRAPR